MAEVKLASLMELETIEQGIYRAQSWDLGFRALFGGQVLGQALSAAYKTVGGGFTAHSFHSYFLLPGDAKKPVMYDVEIVRDGRSFCTRRVKAIQEGRNIFYMTASFQLPEDGMEHQFAVMPDVPPPQDITPDIAFYEANYEKLARPMQEALSYHKPVDIRTVDAVNSFSAKKRDPLRYIWLRAQEEMGTDAQINQASLAYASDYHFLSTALQPHGVSMADRALRIATIDHAMWFHKPVNFNEWLLYVAESPFSGNARGIVKGQIFNRQGELVASTMQEGLMRKIDRQGE
ncbi:acyl-CoA thioesterase II [Alteromonas sp. 1_MG-2023]|uniref:acyl-CoA thioesterase n=1 Tax=unclassified Alteromonas TaxID=2614992 RepID=UPI0026E3696E|nr:acyl-CoA thioesterase II [Alteromonas sp. 1_MG-2023]MDO6477417.1 acyl-CoA thioesterase II [Alteromonas sp. 1_MG-2023]MEC7689785.1 acyl-CoA thioesterase II [Pseudomonadota bacterium]